MKCESCGRVSPEEEANYCFYCGNSFRENVNIEMLLNQKQEEPQFEQVNEETGRKANIDKPITFLNWLLTLGTPFIPFIGPYVFVGLCIYWGFASDVQETRKNWARATLIFLIISFILAYWLMSTVIPALPGLLEGGGLGGVVWLEGNQFNI